MESIREFYLPGLIFILTLLSGLWLSLTGKPLNAVLFNIHKLVALAGVVLTAIRIFNVRPLQGIPSQPLLMLALSAVSTVALFASGAFMSIGKPAYNRMLLVHRIALGLLAVSGTTGILLFLSGSA